MGIQLATSILITITVIKMIDLAIIITMTITIITTAGLQARRKMLNCEFELF